MAATAEQDFADECREAFGRLWLELLKINPNEPAARLVNASRRYAVLRQIDTVLDSYNEWRAL